MSRETNSMLLRYGINTFWSNSISSPKLLYINDNLNPFFNLILKNYFLQPLKIQYKFNSIYLYVFFYKEERLSFLDKFLTLNKLELSRLLLRKNYSNNTIKNINIIKKKKISLKLVILVARMMVCRILYKIIKNKNIPNILLDNNSINILKYKKIRNIRKNIFCLKKKKKLLFKRKKNLYKLKLINYLLKFKTLGIMCTYLVCFYTYNNYKVIFKSALEKLTSLIKFPFSFKYLRNSLLQQKLYIILLGFSFFKSKIINLYISTIIKKTKNKKHIKNLFSIFQLIKILFEKQFICFSGLKFIISGRLNGKLRKGSFGYKLGSIKLMSYDVFVNYSCDFVYTQYGSFSLKLWICENKINF